MRVSLVTLIERSTRNMGLVHPVVKETILEVIKRAYAEGINVQISSGYRSNAEQQRLYNQGRTTPGNIVTNAKPGQSMHNFGLAVDYFLTNKDGTKALWTVDAKWRRVAAIAKSLGFEWGGDWRGFVDYPHLQMTGGLTLAQLQAGRRPNLVSKVGKPADIPAASKPAADKKPAPKKPSGGYKGDSIVDYLKSIGTDSSYANRAKLAKQYGIEGYKGTETQNLELLNKLRSGAKPATKPAAKPKPVAKKKLHLPASSTSWRVYPLNKAPRKGNEKGFLNPKKFGGLTYEIIGNPQKDVYTIQTRDFGKVNIYAAPTTGASIR